MYIDTHTDTHKQNIKTRYFGSKMNSTNSRVKNILSNSRECEDEVFWAPRNRINEHDLIAMSEGKRDSLCQPVAVEPGPIKACVL